MSSLNTYQNISDSLKNGTPVDKEALLENLSSTIESGDKGFADLLKKSIIALYEDKNTDGNLFTDSVIEQVYGMELADYIVASDFHTFFLLLDRYMGSNCPTVNYFNEAASSQINYGIEIELKKPNNSELKLLSAYIEKFCSNVKIMGNQCKQKNIDIELGMVLSKYSKTLKMLDDII